MEQKQKQKILEEVGNLACQYDKDFGGCSQCVVAAIKNTLGHIDDSVFKAATGLAGGVGLSGNNCGAFTGGVLALSSFIGRDLEHISDPEGIRFESFRIARKLIDRFIAEYGSVNCCDIQTKIMGRSYILWQKDEHAAFIAAGGHDDKCPNVCKNAARWVTEILDEEKLI